MTYPGPEFPIGHVVYNRHDEPLTVVARTRADQVTNRWTGRRVFSEEDAHGNPWFYTLRDSKGDEHSLSGNGLQHMERMTAGRRPSAGDDHPMPLTQCGALNVGEQLRNPQGTWTVAESWIAEKSGAQGKDRRSGASSVRGDYHMYYLLTHEDGHQEEWSAPGMVDFHRILPDEQQTLT